MELCAGSQFLTESGWLFEAAFGFSPSRSPALERDHPKTDLIANHLGISGDWTLTTSAHRAEESTLRRHALARIEMIQPLADDGHALVVFADFNAESALPHARQHDLGFQNRGQQTVRHSVSLQLAFRTHTKVQALKSRCRQYDRVELRLAGQLLQAGDHVAPDFHHA